MPDEIDNQIDELVNGLKEIDFDVIGWLKERGLEGKGARYFLRLIVDDGFFKKEFGVTKAEHYLMNEGLTLEEAQYVIKHPCLEDAEDRCSYHKEHSKCVPFGCTLLNGWLHYKTSPDGKLKPNYRAWEKLPKDTLYIDAKSAIEDGTLDKKIEEFLDES